MRSSSKPSPTLRMEPCSSFLLFSVPLISNVKIDFYSNYVDRNTAEREGLVSYTENSFTLRADHTTKLSSDGPGRDSFRLRSNQTYSTHVVMYVIPPRFIDSAVHRWISLVLISTTCRAVAGVCLSSKYIFLADGSPRYYDVALGLV